MKYCLICKVKITKRKNKHYCSVRCYGLSQRGMKCRVNWTKELRNKFSEMHKGPKNPMYGKTSKFRGKKRPDFSGEKHPLFKGGTINIYGYRELSINGNRILEHRYIFEQFYQMKLTNKDIIHHKDGNKLNNNIENLELMDRSNHAKLHQLELAYYNAF